MSINFLARTSCKIATEEKVLVALRSQFQALLYLIHLITMSFSNLIYQQAQRWGNSLAQMAGSGPGYLAENIITPYIHIMVYHVPTMIRNNGSLKYFSGQGNFFLTDTKYLNRYCVTCNIVIPIITTTYIN